MFYARKFLYDYPWLIKISVPETSGATIHHIESWDRRNGCGWDEYYNMFHNSLFTRAWAFQHRLLSSQILYFIDTELFWTCGQKPCPRKRFASTGHRIQRARRDGISLHRLCKGSLRNNVGLRETYRGNDANIWEIAKFSLPAAKEVPFTEGSILISK